jgi:DNA-directed RNA polymerase beta' subunit
MGKRVDFSARSVVSPDSNLELDELGVPRKLADELTIPEEVNQVNLKRMIELGRLGKIKTLIKPNNDKKSYEMWDFE